MRPDQNPGTVADVFERIVATRNLRDESDANSFLGSTITLLQLGETQDPEIRSYFENLGKTFNPEQIKTLMGELDHVGVGLSDILKKLDALGEKIREEQTQDELNAILSETADALKELEP